MVYKSETKFSTPIDKSVDCNKNRTLQFRKVGSDDIVVITISNVKWEAFHKGTDNEFSQSQKCCTLDGCDVSVEAGVDGVLISTIIICSLIGIALVALIGVLIWRKRTLGRILG